MTQQSTQPTTSRVSLDALAPGFANPVQDTQSVFRALLDALARPGTIGTIGTIDTPLPAAEGNDPARAGLAAFASLLTMCDYVTPVWLAQADAGLEAALRFHADAPIAATAADAAFVYVHDAATLPPLDTFQIGTPESPEMSATVFVRVDALTGGAPLTLSGPGIDGTTTIAPVGLPERFWSERAAFASIFPCGPDFYFVCGDSLFGLPRTTHVEVN